MRTREGGGWRRARLRRAAVQLAAHGWPVAPGASLVGSRYSCGPGCPTIACHPSFSHDPDTDPEPAPILDADLVSATWRHTPHAILLPTGVAFDVIEVPSWLAVAAGRRTVRGPVALTPTGRWMFLVRPGSALRSELAALPDLVLHGEGSWIPAPPTPTPQGRVRWIVTPDEVDWRPPVSVLVQAWLAGGLPLRTRPGFPVAQAA